MRHIRELLGTNSGERKRVKSRTGGNSHKRGPPPAAGGHSRVLDAPSPQQLKATSPDPRPAGNLVRPSGPDPWSASSSSTSLESTRSTPPARESRQAQSTSPQSSRTGSKGTKAWDPKLLEGYGEQPIPESAWPAAFRGLERATERPDVRRNSSSSATSTYSATSQPFRPASAGTGLTRTPPMTPTFGRPSPFSANLGGSNILVAPSPFKAGGSAFRPTYQPPAGSASSNQQKPADVRPQPPSRFSQILAARPPPSGATTVRKPDEFSRQWPGQKRYKGKQPLVTLGSEESISNEAQRIMRGREVGITDK